GKIMDALGDLGSLLLGAGRSIVDGLLGGLREKIGDVRSYFQNLTSMIPDWKGPLNKDKHLLEPAGEAIMGGLIRSIDKQRNNLRRTLLDVTKDTAGTDATMTLNPAVEARRRSTSRSRASTGGGQVINITVNGALDPLAVAKQIEDVLRHRRITLGAGA